MAATAAAEAIAAARILWFSLLSFCFFTSVVTATVDVCTMEVLLSVSVVSEAVSAVVLAVDEVVFVVFDVADVVPVVPDVVVCSADASEGKGFSAVFC